jgi:hypothetical protein
VGGARVMVRLELITVLHPCEAVVWVSHLGDSDTAHPAACLVWVYRDFFFYFLYSQLECFKIILRPTVRWL